VATENRIFDNMLPSLLAFAFVLVWLCSYWSNRDLFSPIKLYLLTLFVCFFDIFLKPYRLEICCIYLGLLFVPLVLSKYESLIVDRVRGITQRHNHVRYRRPPRTARPILLIWALTGVPIASMAYLVNYFGGLTQYLNQLAIRHLAFQGINTFLELAIALVSCLTVIYFSIGLRETRSFWWWSLYSFHFVIAFAILSMSGSRRSLVMPIIMLVMVFHYFRASVSARKAAMFLVFVLLMTSAAGVLRMGQRGVNTVTQDLTEVERDSITAHFKYGLVPLDVIFSADVINLRYGSTFVASLTNLIPRPLWPGKPDSAGLAITQDYLGNRWQGTSNLNAGFLVESIMNFGFGVGLVLSFGGITIAMAFLIGRYYRLLSVLREDDSSLHAVFYVVRYLQVAFAITGLITWETAVVVVPLILNLCSIWVVELLILRGPR
jgi:hypothetical protein